jgi:hypothetical protein
MAGVLAKSRAGTPVDGGGPRRVQGNSDARCAAVLRYGLLEQ